MQPGDGWRYRGRGLKQLTGRYNYAAFSKWHLENSSQWPGDMEDFIKHPELLKEAKYATRSAAYFWLSKELYLLADKGAFAGAVDQITEIINRHTDSHKQRSDNFSVLWNKKCFD